MRTRLLIKGSKFLSNGGFFTLLGILLSLAIIAILAALSFRVYISNSSLNNQTRESLAVSGINVSGYGGILDSTRSKIGSISAEEISRVRQLEEIR